MSKPGMNLQDNFLNNVRKENNEVRVLLVNGKMLRGTVKGFDNFTLILNSQRGEQHLIYKHAIAQLVSYKPGHSPRPQQDGSESASAGEASAEAPAQAAARPNINDNRQQRPRKEGFNKLDLSQVKIGDAPEAVEEVEKTEGAPS